MKTRIIRQIITLFTFELYGVYSHLQTPPLVKGGYIITPIKMEIHMKKFLAIALLAIFILPACSSKTVVEEAPAPMPMPVERG